MCVCVCVRVSVILGYVSIIDVCVETSIFAIPYLVSYSYSFWGVAMLCSPWPGVAFFVFDIYERRQGRDLSGDVWQHR